jgi:hypothetical protein
VNGDGGVRLFLTEETTQRQNSQVSKSSNSANQEIAVIGGAAEKFQAGLQERDLEFEEIENMWQIAFDQDDCRLSLTEPENMVTVGVIYGSSTLSRSLELG